jgi:hypothetical protein
MQRQSQTDSKRAFSLVFAGFIALACTVVYFAFRPPLFDNDGYLYRLEALSPDRFFNAIPPHLIWNLIEILIAQVAGVFGYSTSTVPFQVVGIVLNCTTLFLFCVLLMRTSGSGVYAVAATLFVGLSPEFWYVGFQNGPYPPLLLALVGFFWMWATEDGDPPSGRRLFLAAAFMTLVVLLHQAGIFLVLAGVIALALSGKAPAPSRLTRAATWGASIAAIVAAAYVTMWEQTATDSDPFFRWVTGSIHELHPIRFQFPASLVQIVIGATGSIIQSDNIHNYLQEQSTPAAILALYGSLGLAMVVAIFVLVGWTGFSRQLFGSIRASALFVVSLLSLLLWSTFIAAWEPSSVHYWVVTLFPALLVLGILFRSREQRGLWVFASLAVLLSGWNVYLNHQLDQRWSRNFPPPLVAEIRKYVGDRDIFIVLGNEDWFGNMDYDLLFNVLEHEGRNPCVPIVEDFVTPAAGSPNWKDKLRAKIDETLKSGGRVYLANHVLDPDSYDDLAGNKDLFDFYVDERKLSINGPALYQDVQGLVDDYDQKNTGFAIGDDKYVELKWKD